ncbi:TRAP transporter small permease subunit [Thiomicrorhabdus aquaedulcis]|uniref:TRAP transporter small permease subunit n=1 Tax=Thiomicrorhabdus aquaedulcis TaxID=2211106 RepID=UPI0022B2A6FA|nr:hypothetical protein [Thiomicrorhabdus aquaedulcis]
MGTVLFTLPVMAFILWIGWDYVAASWAVQETSTEGSGIAYLYLLKSVILVMAFLVALQGVAVALNALVQLTQPALTPPQTSINSEHGGTL